jgi:uncharacterized protein with HEPN domain
MSGGKDHVPLLRLHCEKILQWMDARTFADWGRDEILRDAVCMRLFALAEAVKAYLSVRSDLPDLYPEIAWDDIVRFRDRAAHHYEGLDYDVIWDVATGDIPPLLAVVERMERDSQRSGEAPG